MKINTFIFDLGNVLIDWNPEYVFDPMFDDKEKKKHFFENICTMEWNEMQDAGRPIREATDLLLQKHPEWSEYINAYYGRWTEMLGGSLNDTVDIFRQLKETGRYKFYALTNWSAELFPYALDRFDFLHWFDGRVVSGEERMRKPYPEFYQLLLDRYNVKPEEAFFIDDNSRNIQAAETMGINSFHFTTAPALKQKLEELALLT